MRAMSVPPQDELLPLWPTWIGEMQLAEADAHNAALATLAASPGVPGNLFEHAHPSAAWLRASLEAALVQWFERMQVQPAPACRLDARLEALGFGQYRELANAPGATLAGLYFVNAPAGPELDHLRSDCLASHVSFYDPRVGFNALALPGDANFVENHTVQATPGTLMLWPGYLRHTSRVHLAQAPWVRVALRVTLDAQPGGQA